MNFYPALQAQMGSWKYYIAKMKMKEVAKEVDFAYDIYEDRTLSDAIQRELNEKRVKEELTNFLARRKDRFFSSLVVAAIGGTPKFYSVKITERTEFAAFADQEVDEAFGVLTFSGKQRYYALDGQHRLKAIKTLLDPQEELNRIKPDGFEGEDISVLIVIKRDEPDQQFYRSYRRLFSSLNRYAKPTDKDTNIIMDEDDAFAILTRRLISEHDFFKWTGKEKASARVKMSGKNLKGGDSYFTSLQTLYAMNRSLLTSKPRSMLGWGKDNLEKNMKSFMQFRPDEDYLDSLYSELKIYWDALLAELPILKSEPSVLKNHEDEEADHLLFWPIGQELLASVARLLLDEQDEDDILHPALDKVKKVFKPLVKMEWKLRKNPWQYFLLTYMDDSWKMRNEGRSEALALAGEMLRWIFGIDSLDKEEQNRIKKQWGEMLNPAKPSKEIDEMWTEVEKLAQ